MVLPILATTMILPTPQPQLLTTTLLLILLQLTTTQADLTTIQDFHRQIITTIMPPIPLVHTHTLQTQA
jgi:hypothetical protein